jgi:hypothetical protein
MTPHDPVREKLKKILGPSREDLSGDYYDEKAIKAILDLITQQREEAFKDGLAHGKSTAFDELKHKKHVIDPEKPGIIEC